MLDNVHAKLLMVHFRNRGGLLVNAFNCHRNGAKVSLYGGDRAELHSAVAIELSADPTKRKERLMFIDVIFWGGILNLNLGDIPHEHFKSI